MSYFEKAFEELLDREGCYTEDKGGPTRFGVTEKVARRNGYKGDMDELTIEFAKAVYHKDYWNKVFDEFSYAVAYQIFDAAVNSGPETAAKWFQNVVGTSPDGIIGPKTIAASKTMPDAAIILSFNAHRLEFMTGLSNWSDASKGWTRRIVKNMLMAV